MKKLIIILVLLGCVGSALATSHTPIFTKEQLEEMQKKKDVWRKAFLEREKKDYENKIIYINNLLSAFAVSP